MTMHSGFESSPRCKETVGRGLARAKILPLWRCSPPKASGSDELPREQGMVDWKFRGSIDKATGLAQRLDDPLLAVTLPRHSSSFRFPSRGPHPTPALNFPAVSFLGFGSPGWRHAQFRTDREKRLYGTARAPNLPATASPCRESGRGMRRGH
jgi:hypothetical protein